MDKEVISTAEGAYSYFVGDYKEADPEYFQTLQDVGTKSIAYAWLEDEKEKITLPPTEKAKFIKMLDDKLNFFERNNFSPLLFELT